MKSELVRNEPDLAEWSPISDASWSEMMAVALVPIIVVRGSTGGWIGTNMRTQTAARITESDSWMSDMARHQSKGLVAGEKNCAARSPRA